MIVLLEYINLLSVNVCLLAICDHNYLHSAKNLFFSFQSSLDLLQQQVECDMFKLQEQINASGSINVYVYARIYVV